MEYNIQKLLEKIIKDNPNDTELGKKIRTMYVENKITELIKKTKK